MIVLNFLNIDLGVTIKYCLGRKVRLSSERMDSAGLAGKLGSSKREVFEELEHQCLPHDASGPL